MKKIKVSEEDVLLYWALKDKDFSISECAAYFYLRLEKVSDINDQRVPVSNIFALKLPKFLTKCILALPIWEAFKSLL
ncbi:hypothetical protein AKG34_21315 [Peribacillus butanolivorans]|uniref:hypothetical protein n=1 Tax=Peribacillus butanolivorans TaxID=421767 RepID=UPI0006A71567|nr:hypothetical protein [Peribacillus butanolivorans]KON67362.1 hypothetical protein AKG34_21315 [Peribacillus butanolivorans]